MNPITRFNKMLERPIFRTFSFYASCVGMLGCVVGACVAVVARIPAWGIVFFGNALLCAMGAATHWYLDRVLTPKKPTDKTKA